VIGNDVQVSVLDLVVPLSPSSRRRSADISSHVLRIYVVDKPGVKRGGKSHIYRNFEE
jgi:hypothetical protein